MLKFIIAKLGIILSHFVCRNLYIIAKLFDIVYTPIRKWQIHRQFSSQSNCLCSLCPSHCNLVDINKSFLSEICKSHKSTQNGILPLYHLFYLYFSDFSLNHGMGKLFVIPFIKNLVHCHGTPCILLQSVLDILMPCSSMFPNIKCFFLKPFYQRILLFFL